VFQDDCKSRGNPLPVLIGGFVVGVFDFCFLRANRRPSSLGSRSGSAMESYCFCTRPQELNHTLPHISNVWRPTMDGRVVQRHSDRQTPTAEPHYRRLLRFTNTQARILQGVLYTDERQSGPVYRQDIHLAPEAPPSPDPALIPPTTETHLLQELNHLHISTAHPPRSKHNRPPPPSWLRRCLRRPYTLLPPTRDPSSATHATTCGIEEGSVTTYTSRTR
jgi:hypothetical protein